jgi:protein gp37
MRLFSERVRYWDDIYWNDIAEKPGAHEAAYRVGVKAAGRTLDGRIWNQVPV